MINGWAAKYFVWIEADKEYRGLRTRYITFLMLLLPNYARAVMYDTMVVVYSDQRDWITSLLFWGNAL